MPAIEIRQLCKHFGRTQVLFDVDLSVEAGQVYGLLGPNGSGKTTTLSCALGLLRATSGEARVLGESSRAIHRTHGRVGVVFDRSVTIGALTAHQNLEYVRRLGGYRGGRSIDELLKLVGLDELANRRASRMSLGQGKRLAIAGALLGQPQLLILDEPLSGLDTLGVRSMLRLFTELAGEGVTLVLSSHRLHEMESVVTHAGIVLRGRVVRQGAIGELLMADRKRYEVEVQQLDLAQAALAEISGVVVESVTSPGAGGEEPLSLGGRLVVDLGELAPEALNRRLVEVGCEVSELTPIVMSLQKVFEDLVDKHQIAEVA